jgi:D-lactate dehydrogenase, membrane binding
MFPSAQGDFFECADDEGDKAFLHRFATAGAAIRYRAIRRREVEDIVALDVALRRNDPDWVDSLPDDVAKPIMHKLYYGHFFCHVFVMCFIRTTLSAKATTRSNSSTECGHCWMRAALNTQPNTMLAICTRQSRRSSTTTRALIPATVSILASVEPPNICIGSKVIRTLHHYRRSDACASGFLSLAVSMLSFRRS